MDAELSLDLGIRIADQMQGKKRSQDFYFKQTLVEGDKQNCSVLMGVS